MKTLEVLFEDNHLLIVNKPAGILSQGDETGDKTIMDIAKQYIKEKYNKPGEVFLGCVHRLDRPVSGLMVLARTSKALSRLNQQFKNKQVQKTYWAVVDYRPDPVSGELKHFLIKDNRKNISKALPQPKKGAKEAVLKYKLIQNLNKKYLIEVLPLTGRPHQIRVQIASLGCPISGDLKYGSELARPDGNIMLHAYQISFQHPVRKNRMTVTCEPPPEWKLF